MLPSLSRAPCLGKKKPPPRPEPKKDFRNSAASSLHRLSWRFRVWKYKHGKRVVGWEVCFARPQGLYMSLPFLKPRLWGGAEQLTNGFKRMGCSLNSRVRHCEQWQTQSWILPANSQIPPRFSWRGQRRTCHCKRIEEMGAEEWLRLDPWPISSHIIPSWKDGTWWRGWLYAQHQSHQKLLKGTRPRLGNWEPDIWASFSRKEPPNL